MPRRQTLSPAVSPHPLTFPVTARGQVMFGKDLVTSPRVIGEYREVVRRAKFRRYGFPPPWLEFLIEESLRLPDPAAWTHRGPDPKNMPFLALAHVAGAWLVTGNLKHFPKAVRNRVTVLVLAEYLAQLDEGE
jgi:uncharacterized protein